MTLAVILFCLLGQRYLGAICRVSDEQLFVSYHRLWWQGCIAKRAALSRYKAPIIQLLLFCLPLIAGVCLIDKLVFHSLGVVGYFIWCVMCLWLCTDAYDPSWYPSPNTMADSGMGATGQHDYPDLSSVSPVLEAVGTSQAADLPHSQAAIITATQPSAAAMAASDDNDAQSQQERETALCLFSSAFSRIFVLWFCFALAGPVAVIVYRMCYLVRHCSPGQQLSDQPASATGIGITSRYLAGDILMLMDWIPARLLGLSYALVGRFAPSMSLWWQQLSLLQPAQEAFAADCGVAALDDQDMAQGSVYTQARTMVNRCLVLWLVGFSLLTMMRW